MAISNVLYNGRLIGEVVCYPDGLFYQIKCKCELITDDIYRLMVSDHNVVLSVGICMPQGDHLILNKRIPSKYLNGEVFEFWITPSKKNTTFLPVDHNGTFTEFRSLENACLQIINGQTGIRFSARDILID